MRVSLHGDRTALEILLNMALVYLESVLPNKHGMAHLQHAGGTLAQLCYLVSSG